MAKFHIIFLLLIFTLFSQLSTAIPTKSISEFLRSTNDEQLDQWAEVNNAITACSNNSFILLVDCKVFIDIGLDFTRPIFIESGTRVEFTNDGLFLVNTMFLSAFVFANTQNVTFLNWNVKYVGHFVGTTNYGYYTKNGTINPMASSSLMGQAGFFSDGTLKNYLIKNRNIKFVQQNPNWYGPSGTGAMFHVRGESQYLNFINLNVYTNKNSHGSDMIPFLFVFGQGWRSGQTVNSTSPSTYETVAVPSDLTFYNVTLDGVVMAFQGNLQRANFTKIRSYRYTDIQDLAWDQSGGVGKYFPPPHLFYLNYVDGGDSRLFNYNITLSDIVDYGQRVGLARDKNNGNSVSGDARSLKIGGHNVIIDNYVSYRPDGFLDLLSSNNLIMRNVKATFDSSFLYYELTPIRLPSSSYKNILIDGMEIYDLAQQTNLRIFGGIPASSSNFIMKNVNFTYAGSFTGSTSGLTSWGSGTNMNINYSYNYFSPSTKKRETLPISYLN